MYQAGVLSFVLFLSIALVAAVSPQQGAAVIREQQLLHEEESQLYTRRRNGLSSESSMSCPSKPQEAGQPKAEWPELQGKTVEEAKAVLQQEAPGFQIQVIGPDMMATMEWRCDRIRLWLDKQQRVSQAPRVG